jgi:hypothetical protein
MGFVGVDRHGVQLLRSNALSDDWDGHRPSLSRDTNVWCHALPRDDILVRAASADCARRTSLAFGCPLRLVIDRRQRRRSSQRATRLATPRKWVCGSTPDRSPG